MVGLFSVSNPPWRTEILSIQISKAFPYDFHTAAFPYDFNSNDTHLLRAVRLNMNSQFLGIIEISIEFVICD